jgi:hypothetical protein
MEDREAQIKATKLEINYIKYLLCKLSPDDEDLIIQLKELEKRLIVLERPGKIERLLG